MAKRRSVPGRGGPGQKEPIETQSGALKHNPFAALAPKREDDDAPVPSTASDARERPEAPSGPAFAPKVVVRRETKGRGGKTVTRISGIAPAHRDAMLARMKKALGCGATVEGEDVLLLGSLVDRAADWLEAEGARRVVRAR